MIEHLESRWVRSRLRPTAAGSVRLRVAALLLLGLGAVACGGTAPDGVPAGPRPPVILISVDTLRSDHLPVYGYDAVETPAIDALAADSIVFENAFAHAPSTLPSHGSILTGLLPTEHGARDNGGFTLDADVDTLAERLAALGYRTGAFVSAFPVRAETGLDAGFATYDDEFDPDPGAGMSQIYRDGSDTLDRTLAWLDAGTTEEAGSPPFLFFHIFEPHSPYEPPPDIAARFESLYDGEIAQSDRLVGRLLARLQDRGLYEDALVVFLSDHGESLGEHGEAGHGIFIYRSVLQVPLIVKLPGGDRGGTRVSDATGLLDVMPTVLHAVNGIEPEDLPGRSRLVASGESPATIYAESYAPQLHFGWSPLVSLIDYPLQYIEAPRPELYDLEADPAQLDNLAESRPDDVRRLSVRLFNLTVPVDAAPTVDAETRERLAALGYIGAGGNDEGGERPDPKDKIHLLDELRTAADLFFAERYDEAIAAYENILRDEPNLDADAWRFLGRAQMQVGRFEDAVVSFETMLAMGAEDTGVDLALGELYLALGRPDDAALAARRAQTSEPAGAAVVLARVSLGSNDLDEGRRQLEAALAADPEHAPAHALLAQVLLASGDDPQTALVHADRAIAIAGDQPQGRGLRVLRGRILLALQRPGDASAEFIEEARRHPTNLQAYQQLAALHLSAGNDETGFQVLESMLQANPGPSAEAVAIDTLRQLGRADAAEQWRQRAAQRYPGEAAFLPGGNRP